jgi:chromate reductase
MTDQPIQTVAICGSLRKASLNKGLLRAAIELAPASMKIEVAEIRDIPLYDEDIRSVGFPPSVIALREAIAHADAVLIVSPEYNQSVPGVLKNAIDWASRPPDQPFAGKALGMLGASPGPLGTARGQYHLRHIAVAVDLHPINEPLVFVTNARSKFDADSNLTDEGTRKFVGLHLEALEKWARRLRGDKPAR